ncbi:N-acetylglucosamine kinase [Deinococcus aerolatus]|uniref:N-acetylglucosamine kinase n=1 Tax=Deinococcus aerolatus TaxID=522487 RepID=A0ABQ2GCL5_9DEIO|nr:BadF/BadG/BcrA/BcrD ATPase family protein [Deinococcus aerolatus]GGL86966.1 N-acetylglucosamine kinase [Deinococcus aerolatus]
MSGLVLGIDAGNTKTIALIADTSGTVLGWGRAGRSNIYVQRVRALAALDTAATRARASARLDSRPFAALTLSAAGADWPEDFDMLKTELRRRNWAGQVSVVNDAVGALRAGSLAGRGVTVVCGTSAGIAACSPGGVVWHTSYWQEPEGATQLAEHALRAVYRADLGIDPPTKLTAPVLAYFGCPDVEALLHSFTRRGRRPPSHLGRLARVLLDQADAGDPASLRIVREHGASLGDYALAAARKVRLDGTYLLTTSGGVMRHRSPILREALLARVRREHPQVRWQASHHEPVFGAVLLALEAAGVPVDEQVFRRLEQTCPDEALFLT